MADKLKIGIMGLAAWPLPMEEGKISAPQSILFNLITELKSLGHEVKVFTGKDSKIDADIISGALSSADKEFGPEIDNPIIFTQRKIEYDFILASEAIDAFKRGEIEVLNSHDIRFNPYLFAKTELPMIYTAHFNLGGSVHAYDKYRYELMSRSKNLAVANISRKNEEFCKNMGLNICGYVPNGIDAEKFSYMGPDGRDGLLLVGRMVPGKKIKEAIQIAEKLNQKIILIGPIGAKDNEKQYFEELEKEYLDKDFVDYVGPKFGDELIKYYQSSRVLLYPSESEGMPLGILEAMSSGLPVVASNVGGVPDIIEDGVDGCSISGFNPDEWVEKVKLALTIDPQLCRKKVQDNHTIKKMSEGYIAAYRNMLEERVGMNA